MRTERVLLADLSLPSRPLPKLPLREPPPARAARLTWLSTQVRVKALRLEHDEQRAPAQEDCREEEVFQHCCAGHPPAAPMGCGQGGRHGAARRPGSGFGSGSAATCTQTSASAAGAAHPVRPTPAAAAARGACHRSAAQAVGARGEGSPSPAWVLGQPVRGWLVRPPSAPGQRSRPGGETSLGGFRGNLRQGNKEGLRHAQGRGINRALCRSDTAWGPVGEAPYVRIPGQGHTWGADTPWDPDRSPPARTGDPSSELVPSTTRSANSVRNGPPPTRSLA